MKLIFAALLASFTVALAQSKPEDFRMVNGQVYNIRKSTNWVMLGDMGEGSHRYTSNGQRVYDMVKASEILSNGDVCFEVKRVTRRIGGEYLKVETDFFYVRNYPHKVNIGVRVDSFMVMRLQAKAGDVGPTFDYGTPVTNSPTKPKPPKGTNVPAKVTR